jgi:hypothetical protein
MAISKVVIDTPALRGYVRQSAANTADMWLRLQELRIRIAALALCDLGAYGFSRGDAESVLDGIAAAGRTNGEIDAHVKDTRRRAEAADRIGDILGIFLPRPVYAAGGETVSLMPEASPHLGWWAGLTGKIGGWIGSFLSKHIFKIDDEKPSASYIPPAEPVGATGILGGALARAAATVNAILPWKGTPAYAAESGGIGTTELPDYIEKSPAGRFMYSLLKLIERILRALGIGGSPPPTHAADGAPGYVPRADSADSSAPPEQASKAGDLDPAQRVEAIKTKIEREMGRLPDPWEDTEGEECVAWARLRRNRLNATPMPATGAYPQGDDVALYGAWNYNHIYQDATKPVEAHPLEQQGIVAGDALISRPTTSNPWGHIAIVEAVYPDGLIISQANVKQARIVKFVPRDELASWLRIPAEASPTEAQS